MTELEREAIIVISIMLGIMVFFICSSLVYAIIVNIKDRKEKPKIEDLQRQLEHQEASSRALREVSAREEGYHRALELAVMLCKEKNLNLKQLEELGLQRYNALQTRGNYITDLAYEEFVKYYIVNQGERYRYERNISNQIKKN